jgi:hypothetical protein
LDDGHRQVMADLAASALCTELPGCPASLHTMTTGCCPADDTVAPTVVPIQFSY